MKAKTLELVKRKALAMNAPTRRRYVAALRVSEAQRELLRRYFAQERLIDFCCYVDPDMTEMYLSPHLCLIADYLERAEADTLWEDVEGIGEKILIVSTPPRHWKSSLVSQKFPAWFMGKRWSQKNSHEMILASYASPLAVRNSRYVLETIRDNPYFQNVFPNVTVSRMQQASDDWKLVGSVPTSMKAAGVGGGLTGYGGVVGIDDPIKDRAQANSRREMATQWDWWSDVARTRINPNQFAIIVMTRWVINDIVGKIMVDVRENPNVERVVYLRLPAIAETERERRAAAKAGLD